MTEILAGLEPRHELASSSSLSLPDYRMLFSMIAGSPAAESAPAIPNDMPHDPVFCGSDRVAPSNNASFHA